MAADGIAALCINTPFGLPEEATERYGQALSAVSSAIDLLAKQRRIDRTRVGMGGLSFGSEVTLWVAMKSDLLAAASVTSTSMSPTYYWFVALKGEKYLDIVKKAWGLGSPAQTPERWKLLSPTFNIDKIHAPLLMQMPEQEYLQTMDYFGPLTRSATPADMYVYPNESHQKVLPRHKLAAYERNLDWFRFWLQGHVDPDPRKAAQYARWQAQKDRAANAGLVPQPAAPTPTSKGP
jgi:dipeptidyl aminopeptidase/acylaminoacyl peptidase